MLFNDDLCICKSLKPLIMLKRKIGENAGIIWRLLADKGALSIREVVEHTNFNALDMRMALGWLSKEDKISFVKRDGKLYINLQEIPSDLYY